MKRDMDKVRGLLLALEAKDAPYFMALDVECLGGIENPQEMVEYIKLLTSGGLLEMSQRSVYRISWDGHEFLDNVRDPEIWKMTKDGATKVGSWSLKLLGEMATGFIRAKAAELGLPIG